jgi:GAF domain-containing protein
LRRYRILDTAPESEYDDITALAAYICGTPVAVISLVDHERQWFKSKVGTDTVETSREIAFCAHTVMGHDVLVVPDALADERFESSPLTQEPYNVRFYAGAPLITPEGYAVGALCAIDHQPRHLTTQQTEALTALGRQVVRLLESRRVAAELAEALEAVRLLNSLLPICAYCRKVRDDVGYWTELEAYVSAHTDAQFSHGICPECAVANFGGVAGGESSSQA